MEKKDVYLRTGFLKEQGWTITGTRFYPPSSIFGFNNLDDAWTHISVEKNIFEPGLNPNGTAKMPPYGFPAPYLPMGKSFFDIVMKARQEAMDGLTEEAMGYETWPPELDDGDRHG